MSVADIGMSGASFQFAELLLLYLILCSLSSFNRILPLNPAKALLGYSGSRKDDITPIALISCLSRDLLLLPGSHYTQFGLGIFFIVRDICGPMIAMQKRRMAENPGEICFDECIGS